MTFAYVSGDPALDLAATVGTRRTAPDDLLATPADLERWVAGCDGLPGSARADAAAFAAALELREAVYRLALDRVHDRPYDTAGLRIVNEAAAGPPPALTLTRAGLRTSGGIAAALTQIARGAILLLADPDAHLKECARPDCTRIYVDRSRGARRTWCGMEECGNRAKAATYRARKRAGAART